MTMKWDSSIPLGDVRQVHHVVVHKQPRALHNHPCKSRPYRWELGYRNSLGATPSRWKGEFLTPASGWTEGTSGLADLVRNFEYWTVALFAVGG